MQVVLRHADKRVIFRTIVPTSGSNAPQRKYERRLACLIGAEACVGALKLTSGMGLGRSRLAGPAAARARQLYPKVAAGIAAAPKSSGVCQDLKKTTK